VCAFLGSWSASFDLSLLSSCASLVFLSRRPTRIRSCSRGFRSETLTGVLHPYDRRRLRRVLRRLSITVTTTFPSSPPPRSFFPEYLLQTGLLTPLRSALGLTDTLRLDTARHEVVLRIRGCNFFPTDFLFHGCLPAPPPP